MASKSPTPEFKNLSTSTSDCIANIIKGTETTIKIAAPDIKASILYFDIRTLAKNHTNKARNGTEIAVLEPV